MSVTSNPDQPENEPVLATEIPLDSEELGLEVAETSKSEEPLTSTGQFYTDDEIRELIAMAAYEKAKKRGFQPGFEEQDWLEAEKEILSEYLSS